MYVNEFHIVLASRPSQAHMVYDCLVDKATGYSVGTLYFPCEMGWIIRWIEIRLRQMCRQPEDCRYVYHPYGEGDTSIDIPGWKHARYYRPEEWR